MRGCSERELRSHARSAPLRAAEPAHVHNRALGWGGQTPFFVTRAPQQPEWRQRLSHDDEQALVERAKRDPAAFEELYDRYIVRIYRYVYSRLRDRSAAEDVTSDVFMKVLTSIGRYNNTGRPFAAWLYQIAACSVVDRYRAARPVEDIDQQHDLAAAGPPLEEVAAQRDELRQIWSVVEALPSGQRVAMVLRYQEDMRIDDIAATMGRSPAAVKLLLHRGLHRVRRILGVAA